LQKEPDVQVETIDGSGGEFTVQVNGQEVARKGDSMPSVAEVLRAVKGEPTGAPA
jgi:hypothetical protein